MQHTKRKRKILLLSLFVIASLFRAVVQLVFHGKIILVLTSSSSSSFLDVRVPPFTLSTAPSSYSKVPRPPPPSRQGLGFHDDMSSTRRRTSDTTNIAATMSDTSENRSSSSSSSSNNHSYNGMAACLFLHSSDKEYLNEWLQYHYDLLPLRRLIVGIENQNENKNDEGEDEQHLSTVQAILQRFNETLPLMDITIWPTLHGTKEEDEEENEESVHDSVNPNSNESILSSQHHQHFHHSHRSRHDRQYSPHLPRRHVLHHHVRIKARQVPNLVVADYLVRQMHFYSSCLRVLKKEEMQQQERLQQQRQQQQEKEQRQEEHVISSTGRFWVTLIDADDFIVVNPHADATHRITTSQPTVVEMLHSNSNLFFSSTTLGTATIATTAEDDGNDNDTNDNYLNNNLNTFGSACLPMHRLRMSHPDNADAVAVEAKAGSGSGSGSGGSSDGVGVGGGLDALTFSYTRSWTQRSHTLPSKTLVDLSRVNINVDHVDHDNTNHHDYDHHDFLDPHSRDQVLFGSSSSSLWDEKEHIRAYNPHNPISSICSSSTITSSTTAEMEWVLESESAFSVQNYFHNRPKRKRRTSNRQENDNDDITDKKTQDHHWSRPPNPRHYYEAFLEDAMATFTACTATTMPDSQQNTPMSLCPEGPPVQDTTHNKKNDLTE
jgi:hypothetical protein